MARSKEETRKAKRESMARKRHADPEAARAYNRARHRKNREKQCAKMRDYYAKRFFWGRAMKLRGEGRATTLDLARLWRKQKGMCAYTGARLDRTAQLDHLQPKAASGSDRIENLQWVTAAVNYAKRDLPHEGFVALCGSVMRWIGERIQAVEDICNAR